MLYHPPPKFLHGPRYRVLLVDAPFPAVMALLRAAGELLELVKLFDVHGGAASGGKKSGLFASLRTGPQFPHRSVRDKAMRAAISALETEFGALSRVVKF